MKSHDNPFNSDSYFCVIYVTVLCEPNCNPDALSSILHIWLYVPINLICSIVFFYDLLFFPEFIFQRKSVTLPCRLLKRFREHPQGFQRSFLADHMQRCCMRTEQHNQRSFVIPSTILENNSYDIKTRQLTLHPVR